MATTLPSPALYHPALYHVCCNCSASGAVLKCSCLNPVYYCGPACQQAHYLEHKHECTDHLLKVINKKGAVISRLQVQGSSNGVASVELMVLEQELARVHYKVGRLVMESLQEGYQVPGSRDTLQAGTAPVAQGGGVCGCVEPQPGPRQASWLTRQRQRVFITRSLILARSGRVAAEGFSPTLPRAHWTGTEV